MTLQALFNFAREPTLSSLAIAAYRSCETVNREIPQLYIERKYNRILEYIGDGMEGYELVYQAIKKERFYSELMALRAKLLK